MNAGPRNSGDPSRRRGPRGPERPVDGGQAPLPPEIYRRRRIAAVAGVVVVILLLWWLLSSLGGSEEQENTAATSSTTPSSSAPASEKKTPEAKKAEKTPTATAIPPKEDEQKSEKKDPAADKRSCELADLRLTAVPGKPNFDASEQPTFFVKIHNPTKADCVIDVDEEKILFEVFALKDYQRVWGDLDCNEASVSGEVKIAAGQTQNYKMGAWSRTTSAPDRCEDRQPVGAGSYLLYAHLGSNVSPPATFNMG